MADAQLALTHQVAITLGGQVLSENWVLLKKIDKESSQTLRCPERLICFANTDFASFSKSLILSYSYLSLFLYSV